MDQFGEREAAAAADSDAGDSASGGAGDAIDLMNATLSDVLAKAKEKVDATAFAVAIKRQELEAAEAEAEEEEARLDELREQAQALVDDEQWQEMYRRLRAWSREQGHCNPRRNWQSKIDAEEKALGNWAGKQRYLDRQGKLDQFRKEALDRIGFSWDAVQRTWDQFEAKLREYVKVNGKIKNINQLRTTGGGLYATARHYQRVPKLMLGAICYGKVKGEKKPMQNARFTQERLDFITECGINWDLTVDQVLALKEKGFTFPMPEEHVVEEDTSNELVRHHWRRMYEALVSFKKENQHTCVTASNSTPELAEWVAKQRRLMASQLDKDYVDPENTRTLIGNCFVKKKALLEYQAEMLLAIDFMYMEKDLEWEAKREETQRGEAQMEDTEMEGAPTEDAEGNDAEVKGAQTKGAEGKEAQTENQTEDAKEQPPSNNANTGGESPNSSTQANRSIPANTLARPPWAAVILPEATKGEAKVLAEEYQKNVWKLAEEYRKKALADPDYHLPLFKFASKADEVESFKLFQRCCGPLAATASGREKLVKNGELVYGDGRSLRLCRVAGCQLIHSEIPEAKYLCEWHYMVVHRPLKDWKDSEGSKLGKRPCQSSYTRSRKETRLYDDRRYQLDRLPKMTIHAPPGELDLSLVNGPDRLGVIVKSVSGVSADVLCPGDCISSVDYVDVREKTADEVLSIMANKSSLFRRIVLVRYSRDKAAWHDLLGFASDDDGRSAALREIDVPDNTPPPPKLLKEPNAAPRAVRRIVYAPPGSLGIQLDNGKSACVEVSVVSHTSPLASQVFVGDCLVGIDLMDMRGKDFTEVVEIFRKKSDQVRRLEILRFSQRGSAPTVAKTGDNATLTDKDGAASGTKSAEPVPKAPSELPVNADAASAAASDPKCLDRLPKMIVHAPPGDLGLSLVNGPGRLGVIVKSVSGVSADVLCPGDCISSVDCVDVREKTADEVLSIMANKSSFFRRIVLVRYSRDKSAWQDLLGLAPEVDGQSDALREIDLTDNTPPPPEPNAAPRVARRIVYAPPGSLGVQLVNGKSTRCVEVSVVSHTSPLASQVLVGDCLVGVDLMDIRSFDVKEVVEIFRKKSDQVRRIEILRFSQRGSAPTVAKTGANASLKDDNVAAPGTTTAEAESAPKAPSELPVNADATPAAASDPKAQPEQNTGQEVSTTSATAIETPLAPADVDMEEVEC